LDFAMTIHVRPPLLETDAPSTTPFARDVIAGLSETPKTLPAKYFYDTAGSRLFEEITRLPEYYPTRTEVGILRDNAAAIAALIPRGAALVEFGAGSASKVRILLEAAPHIAAYVPVDISAEFLGDEAARLERDIPRVAVHAVAADFTQDFALPAAVHERPRVGFFPGSTIGNFNPRDARHFLRQAARILGPGAMLIVGADLIKDEATLHAAYNDAAGVTAKFNLNLLVRINRELGANFDVGAFEHQARFDHTHHRIEMHLVGRRPQQVQICGHAIDVRAGETIHTENSYKFTIGSFATLARRSNWMPSVVFTDTARLFSVHVLTRGRRRRND
jgi:dimethylhistidine N-methyltransferase